MREQIVKDIEKEFLEPSFKYLVNNGLENTSVRDLCKAMNISYGSIYYWFEGKDDIFISVVKYGIAKVVGKIFDFVFEKIKNPEKFFNEFLDEVDQYKPELRLVFQFAASPEYGNAIRTKAEEFKAGYSENIVQLAKIIDSTPEKVAPIIYSLISVVVDYAIWEDREASEMQIEFLRNILVTMC